MARAVLATGRRAAPAVAAALLASPAEAAVLHVSPNGRDEAAGTAAQPWRTLARAVRALGPGDRLVIGPGRYGEGLLLSASGRPGRPITVVGQGRPLVEGGGDAVSVTGSWVEVEGLEAHSTGWGSAFAVGKHNHHVRLARNIARDSACGGIAAVQTDYLTVEGNRVFGNGRRAPWQCSGISIYQAEASDGRPGYHNVIRDNVSYDNLNVVVDDAVSHSEGHTTDGNGIILDDFEHSQPGGSTAPPYRAATLVLHNLVFDNGGRGVHVFKSRNVHVVGNTAYHDAKDPNLQGLRAELSAAFSQDTVWIDNVAEARPGAPALSDAYSTGPNTWDHDVAAGDPPTLAERSGVRWGAHVRRVRRAGFVRPATAPGGDFRLRPDSPARGAGVDYVLGGPGLLALRPGRGVDAGAPPPPPLSPGA